MKHQRRLITLVALVCFPVLQASAAEYNLKLMTYISPKMAFGIENMAERIEKQSGGRIETTVFTGGELVSSSDSLNAVKSGTIDIAWGSGYHWSQVDFAPVSAGMPMTWNSPMEAEMLWEEQGFHELVAEGYDQLGVQYLGPIWAAPYAITTKEPVNSIEDLKDMKLRATTGAAKMFSALDISSVYMKPEEMYVGLSTGQIDGVLYGGAIEYSELGFPEVAPYYNTTFIVNPITDALVINQELWNELPEDLKGIIESAAYQARLEYFSWVMNQEYKTRNDNYKGNLTSFSAEDVKEMTDAAKVTWEDQAETSELNAKMVEKVKEFLRSVGRLE